MRSLTPSQRKEIKRERERVQEREKENVLTWDLRSDVLKANGVAERFKVVKLSERLFARDDLPQDDPKTVDIGFFIKLLSHHHFGRHPKRSSLGAFDAIEKHFTMALQLLSSSKNVRCVDLVEKTGSKRE